MRSFPINRCPVTLCSKVILVHIFLKYLSRRRSEMVRTSVSVGWLWRHSPQLVPRKRIQRSTNMSFVLQLQAVIQNCLGAHYQLAELLTEKNSLLQREDSAKIAVMDCGFKLIKIFQQEL